MAGARQVRRIGLIAGPLLALACYMWLPVQYADPAGQITDFSHAGRATAAMMVWMAVWWMTEAVEIEVTALLPLVAFPLAGIAPLARTAAPYASDVVFLFLGGFVLAAAIQRWGLDRRLAFATLRLAGPRPGAMVAGVLGVTAFTSMWVSNTATAAMMLPIVIALIDLVLQKRRGRGLRDGGIPAEHSAERRFALSLLLAIAYGASLGGVATIIGTPPNGILVRFLEQTYGQAISFGEWMLIGLPVTLAFLPLAWWLLARVVYPSGIGEIEGGRKLIEEEYRRLGPLTTGERVTLGVFAATVFLWVFRPLLAGLTLAGTTPFARLTDAGIAMAAALALFLIPVDRRAGVRAMDWNTASRVPWGVLILFGGGLTLAAAVEANGVAEYIGSFAPALGGWPTLAIVVTVVALTVFLSELTSNTAQVATMLPLLAAAAPALGLPPALLLVPCTIAASCAFMLPVGTPPNAIVFGSGLVTIPQMCRAGIWLNLIGIVLITAAAYLVVAPLLVAGSFPFGG